MTGQIFLIKQNLLRQLVLNENKILAKVNGINPLAYLTLAILLTHRNFYDLRVFKMKVGVNSIPIS